MTNILIFGIVFALILGSTLSATKKPINPQILTPKLCAWILSGFCSVPADKREAKTG